MDYCRDTNSFCGVSASFIINHSSCKNETPPPTPLTCNIFIVVDYRIPGVFDIWEVGGCLILGGRDEVGCALSQAFLQVPNLSGGDGV